MHQSPPQMGDPDPYFHWYPIADASWTSNLDRAHSWKEAIERDIWQTGAAPYLVAKGSPTYTFEIVEAWFSLRAIE